MAKTKQKFAIVADVETGGLPTKTKLAFDNVALTEIAFVAIDLKQLKIIEKESWFFEYNYKDGLEYHPKALESTGISIDLLKEKGASLADIHNETRSFIKRHSEGRFTPIIVGHNVYQFDRLFFENFYKYMSDDFGSYISGYMDTLVLSGLKYLESKNYKLGTICSNLGVELIEAHRALPDTVANAEMFINFVKILRDGDAKKEKDVKFRDKFKLDVNYDF